MIPMAPGSGFAQSRNRAVVLVSASASRRVRMRQDRSEEAPVTAYACCLCGDSVSANEALELAITPVLDEVKSRTAIAMARA